MFFKSGKYNSSLYQIEENSKQDDMFNSREKGDNQTLREIQSKEQKIKVKK